MVFLENLWGLFVDMSFYLVIGILFTGILHAFVQRSFILRHVGGNSFGAVVKASVVGVPLPLCSCGVVPMALYLNKSGASKGASVSYLTSTPQTGLDSIIATYGMLGGFFAVYRAVAAFISGIIAGCVTNIFCRKDKATTDNATAVAPSSCGCGSCNDTVAVTDDVDCCCGEHHEHHCDCTHEDSNSHCCHSHAEHDSCSCHSHTTTSTCGCSTHSDSSDGCSCGSQDSQDKTFMQKVQSIFTYGFGGFLDEIVVNFLVGIVIAALITTLVPDSWFTYFSNPLLQMLMMLVVGIPMYVCSTASIPIAVALVIKGISPGAAFVFLFAGPATNIASLTMLTKSFGKKIMAIYLSCMALCAVGFGLLLDGIIAVSGYTGLEDVLASVHGSQEPVYQVVVAIIFGLLVLFSIAKQLRTKTIARRTQ